jgi:tetratricopeptide (TPR) repeat protein
MARRILSLIALPISLAAELLALLLLLLAEDSLAGLEILSLLGLHLFASVVMAESLRLSFPAGARQAGVAWQLGLSLSLLLPGFGPLLTAVLVARPPRPPVAKSDDFISPMEYRKQQAEAELAAEAHKGHAGVQVEALTDALKDQDKAKRLGAVEALRSLENKQAVELLGRSLKNTVFEVRYHAVEALAAINKKYSSQIAEAIKLAEREPGPRSHGNLGAVYFEYARLEMEDPSIQQHLFRNAAHNLRMALPPDGTAPPDLLNKLAVCMEELGEYDEARKTFRAALAVDPDSMEALLGTARLQFRQAQFEQLPQTCRRILNQGADKISQEYINVVALWAEGPKALGLEG